MRPTLAIASFLLAPPLQMANFAWRSPARGSVKAAPGDRSSRSQSRVVKKFRRLSSDERRASPRTLADPDGRRAVSRTATAPVFPVPRLPGGVAAERHPREVLVATPMAVLGSLIRSRRSPPPLVFEEFHEARATCLAGGRPQRADRRRREFRCAGCGSPTRTSDLQVPHDHLLHTASTRPVSRQLRKQRACRFKGEVTIYGRSRRRRRGTTLRRTISSISRDVLDHTADGVPSLARQRVAPTLGGLSTSSTTRKLVVSSTSRALGEGH